MMGVGTVCQYGRMVRECNGLREYSVSVSCFENPALVLGHNANFLKELHSPVAGWVLMQVIPDLGHTLSKVHHL